MSLPSTDDVLAALRDFTARIDALDPEASLWGDIEVRVGEKRLRQPLRVPVVLALVEALRDYHDPRDQGRCGHCGGRRLDDNFVCRDCGRPNGLFGQLLLERLAGYKESPTVETIASEVPGADADASR